MIDGSNRCKALTEALITIRRKSNCQTFHEMSGDKYCIKHVAPVSTMDNIEALGLNSEQYSNFLPEFSSHLSPRENRDYF